MGGHFKTTDESVSLKNKYLVPNLERGCRVIEHLAQKGIPCGISDLARELKIPKNSVFRILFTLQQSGFVKQVGPEYQISSKLLTLGHMIVGGSTLLEKALPFLKELRDETRETVGFGVLTSENQGIILEQISGLEPIRIQIEVGYSFPLHTAAPGKVLLAFLSQERRDKIISSMEFSRLTANTITDREAYHAELANVQAAGYALDREEQVDHVLCIGAPVFDHESNIAAAIWMTGPVFRMQQDDIPQIARSVMQAGKKISRQLGFGIDL